MVTQNSADISAIIYNIVQIAKENNLKPYEYLKYLFEELPQQNDESQFEDYSKLKGLTPNEYRYESLK